MRYALALAIVILGLAVAGAAPPALAESATPVATPTAGDFAGLVDIGNGRRLWLECRGSGGPTVVLESAYGNGADVWDTAALGPDAEKTAVLPGVAGFTRVCAYDRPGTALDAEHRGGSDPVPMPRTAADAVADLHALLHAADVPGPYVLVGHSFGGIVVRLYAATYPDEVAGMVLVDSSHEDQTARFSAAMTPEEWATFERLQEQPPPGFEDDPDRERFDLDASFAEMRAAVDHPLSLPLVVLSRGLPFAAEVPPGLLPEDFPLDTMDRVWAELQGELAMLTPDGRHVIATESGHYIQLQQPDLVIDAVRAVVDAVRNPASWAIPAAPATPAA